MKINEVPQDKGYLIKGRISDLNYVVDAEGHYTSTTSIGWQPKNEAMRLAWEQVYEKAEEIRKKIHDGDLSPVAFYMEINFMDVAILAAYMELPKRKVRKHLKMNEFRQLPEVIINRYAEVFNISVDQLMNPGEIQNKL